MKATVISIDASPARQRAMKEAVTRNGFEIQSTRVIREPVDPPALHLTPRQFEVLSLLCEGLPNKLISRQLNISGATVKVHVGCILRELGVSSRLQAVVAAPRLDLALPALCKPAEHLSQVFSSTARTAPSFATSKLTPHSICTPTSYDLGSRTCPIC